MPPQLKPATLNSQRAPSLTIQLPHPTQEGIAAFVELYHQKFGVELDAKQALELSTRTLQLAYLAMTPCPKVPSGSVENAQP